MTICMKCAGPCVGPANEYDEFICKECLDNEAEAAYERHIASFHDGGATQWNSLEQQQAAARKLK